MRRWLLAALLLAWLCAPRAMAEGVNRALLVGCDRFVTQESTTPSSENNVKQMAQALSGGAMNLERLVTRTNDVVDADALEELIQSAFGDAGDADVSYFYISTHGVWEQGQPNGEMMLLLSDGDEENGVTANQLRAMFDKIAGMKVLILDACHAGAVIGKGVQPPFDNVFVGDDYKLICSSGGAEESWFWSGAVDDQQLSGAGYFSGAVVSGVSVEGGYGADSNRDGEITLNELKRYLRANHGASTVQTYPEEDDFIFLAYSVDSYSGWRRSGMVDGVVFNEDVLSADDPMVDFSFTMLRPAQVAYQIVYQRQGSWDFDHGRLVYDDAERFGAYGDTPGYLSPGLKERTVTLDRADTGSYGYVLMQMLTLEDGVPSVAASKVLCVPPVEGDPLLEILPQEHFCPEKGEELGFVVQHQYPCELSVTVEAADGTTVRRLASRQPSRPEQLLPRGSTFVWNGRTNAGEIAPEGAYRIRVKAYISGDVYEIMSEPVVLLSPEG